MSKGFSAPHSDPVRKTIGGPNGLSLAKDIMNDGKGPVKNSAGEIVGVIKPINVMEIREKLEKKYTIASRIKQIAGRFGRTKTNSPDPH